MYCMCVCVCWVQYLAMKWFSEFVEDAGQEEGGLQPVLHRIAGLYGVWCLHRHSALLYQGAWGQGAWGQGAWGPHAGDVILLLLSACLSINLSG